MIATGIDQAIALYADSVKNDKTFEYVAYKSNMDSYSGDSLGLLFCYFIILLCCGVSAYRIIFKK
ncbi:hypothetical protein FACS1894139_08010 [Planctomycetales bacterium]|nr:hypothetical protein FACS1894107_00250 [Planctomycetales bacterium]GHS96239.1 hypothetical protein FACS1894108_00530 [Planctomycetales bacterium]GHT04974.1 hypothetical protein FACS1894139_08010 [Planctomycetales bacterium]